MFCSQMKAFVVKGVVFVFVFVSKHMASQSVYHNLRADGGVFVYQHHR
jgi:hypothetical protein